MIIYGLGKYGLDKDAPYDVHPDMAIDLVEAGKAVYAIKEKVEVELKEEKKTTKPKTKKNANI